MDEMSTAFFALGIAVGMIIGFLLGFVIATKIKQIHDFRRFDK